jgi:uncharacterized protein involved in exopolysaccharide biosynthesis/MinD-like ATPase involved in chromosome partitioning or flagellar assembly
VRTVSPLQVLRARWKTIVSVITLALIATLLGLLQFTPVYQASAIISFEPDPSGPSVDERVRQSIQRLRSWGLAEKVILKLNLTRDPEINTALTRRTFYRVSTWFEQPRAEQPVAVPPGTGALALKPTLIAELAGRLDVSAADGKSVRITFSSEDPVKAARIANAVVAQLRLEQSSLQGRAGPPDNSVTDATSGLSTQLAQLAAQMRRAQDELEQARAGASLPVMPAQAPAPEAAAQIAVATRRLEALEARDRKIGDLIRTGAGLEAVAALLDSPDMESLHQQQTDLARRAEELAAMFGAGHPETIALQDEQRILGGRIAQIINASRQEIGREVAMARRTLAELQTKSAVQSAALETRQMSAERLAGLETTVRETRARYETLLARTLTPATADPQTTGGMRIAHAAKAPSAPVFPDQQMTLAASLVGSALLAMCLALMRGPVRTGVRRGADIERAVKLPNLGQIPEASGTTRLGDSLLQDPHSPVSTALNALYASLAQSMADADQRVLAITATDAGAGTTSIAVALGRIAAREGEGRHVLVVDADFRRADLAAQFAAPASLRAATPDEGLVEVLSGEADLCHAIRRDRHSPLHYLPIAATFSNPAELVATHSMQRLMQALREHYSLVIINTPCIQTHPETRALAQLSDTALVIVNWDETQHASLVASVGMLREAGVKVIGTALNRCGQRQQPASV